MAQLQDRVNREQSHKLHDREMGDQKNRQFGHSVYAYNMEVYLSVMNEDETTV